MKRLMTLPFAVCGLLLISGSGSTALAQTAAAAQTAPPSFLRWGDLLSDDFLPFRIPFSDDFLPFLEPPEDAALAAGGITIAADAPEGSATKPAVTQQITDVRKVNAVQIGTQLSITAFGFAPTLGFTRPEVAPYIYITPPADGIWTMDILALPPRGAAGTAQEPVVAHLVFRALPPWFKGIRIHRGDAEPLVVMLKDMDKIEPAPAQTPPPGSLPTR